MLVLSRKKNESIYVNGNIRVVIVDVRGDKVQLGVEAPSEVSVYRSEVLEKIRKSELVEKNDGGARS
jgi:carbon storage regulator